VELPVEYTLQLEKLAEEICGTGLILKGMQYNIGIRTATGKDGGHTVFADSEGFEAIISPDS
jgi:hypothetical protein